MTMRTEENPTKFRALLNTPERNELWVARQRRAKSRARWIVCPSCGHKQYAFRAAEDICGECLHDLWTAHDAAKQAEVNEGAESPLLPIKMTKTPHWLPHPRLAPDTKVPPDAVFSRRRSGYADRTEESPASTLQIIYSEIVAGLAEAYPLAPGKEAMDFLNARYEDNYRAMVPRKTVTGLLDLWQFVQWCSYQAYGDGHAKGRALLMGLNSGDLTVDTFNAAITRQTESIARLRDEAAEGKRGNSP